MADQNEESTLATYLADHPRLVGGLFALLLVLNQGMLTIEGGGGSSTVGT